MARNGVDFDVIVIGAGGAGLSAASEAARAGAEVLLLEADTRTGGSTALSGGVFYASGTSLQRAAGVVDSAEDQFRYYMNVNQHKLEAALVHRLCHDSAASFEWLVSLGVSFPETNLYCSGVDKVRRGHRAAGHGAEIAAAIEGSFSGLSVDVALNSRVEGILREEGRVAGIRIGGEIVRASAVVIASGGSARVRGFWPNFTQRRPGSRVSGISAAAIAGVTGWKWGARLAQNLPGMTGGFCLCRPGSRRIWSLICRRGCCT